jgi:hypothetical protein
MRLLRQTPAGNIGFAASGADGRAMSNKSLLCFSLVRLFINFVLSKEIDLFY